MANIDIAHADLIGTYNFSKGAGAGNWYSPDESSDFHVHLIGLNKNPGYDPVTNPNPPQVLMVKRVELKVTEKHRWWGDIQTDGTFKFDPAKISQWGVVNKERAARLLKIVPGPLIAS